MKKRRIIINNDFYNIFQIVPPVSEEDVYAVVDKVYGTQVDTICLMIDSFGIGKSGMIAPELVELYSHPDTDPAINNLIEFYKSGADPFKMVLDRAKKRGIEFLASIRMNDTHYKDHIYHIWMDQFYYDHLHQRVGEGGSRGGAEFDYRSSAVREYYFRQIQQTVDKYDVDGIELDMTRNCMFFPRGNNMSGFAAECAPLMTDFVRCIREMLDKYGKKRGKHLVLSVVVPYSLYRCREEGLDLPLWARLGYIDMLCLSTPFVADFDRDVADSIKKLPGVQVYAGCDRNVSFELGGGRVVPMQTYRAMAMNYLRQGAEGIYLYNVMSWTMNISKPMPSQLRLMGGQGETNNVPLDYDRNLMNELGSIETLEFKDKLYMISKRSECVDHPYNSLPVRVPPKGEVTLRMSIGDDIAMAQKKNKLKNILLQTVSSDCDDYNNYTVKLNGVDLSRQYAFMPYATKPENVLLFPEPARKGGLPGPENVRRHAVRPIDLHLGINYITIKSYCNPMTITDVEIAIYYS